MIWLTKCLCPQRHCIMAIAWPDGEFTIKEAATFMRQSVQGMIEKKVMNPWCKLCFSRDFHYESQQTPFKTMEEAKGPLKAVESMQIWTGIFHDPLNKPSPGKPN